MTPRLRFREILTAEHGSVFGPEDIENITAAFDAALNKLGRLNHNGPVTATVANTIIQLAKDGERNSEKLCNAALSILRC